MFPAGRRVLRTVLVEGGLGRTNLGGFCPSATQENPLVVKNFGNALRWKHSSTQVKRLFKRNPAKFRIEKRNGLLQKPDILPPPTFSAIWEPTMLPNGWSAPPSSEEVTIPSYPFKVSRTKNKPNDAVGFLPIYAEFRKDGARVTTRIKKVSGDQEIFLSELRSVLQMPAPQNPKDDPIRIRTGGTIEVKGNRVKEVKYWLAGLGF